LIGAGYPKLKSRRKLSKTQNTSTAIQDAGENSSNTLKQSMVKKESSKPFTEVKFYLQYGPLYHQSYGRISQRDEDASAGHCWQNNYPSDLPPKSKEVHSLQWSTLGHVFIFFRRVTKRSVKEVGYTHKLYQ